MSLVHPGTILVVEDDCGYAILITKALRRAHITNPITTPHDGQDAVDLCCAVAGLALWHVHQHGWLKACVTRHHG